MVVFLLDVFMFVVIDFGIIFFGYVFVMRDELEKDLLKIFVFYWYVLDGSLILYKILIIVLLDKDEKLVDFGFDVEIIYVELLENGEYEDYFYFC